MMEWIKPNHEIDFIKLGKPMRWFAYAATVIALGLLVFKGMNYGIDFAGGYEFQLKFPTAVSAADVSKALADSGITGMTVQSYGDAGSNEYLLRLEKNNGVDLKKVEAVNTGLKASADTTPKEFLYNDESPDRIRITFAKDPGEDGVRKAFAAQGLTVKQVVKSARDDRAEYQVSLESIADRVEASLKDKLKLPPDAQLASRVEFVGPAVGKQLRNQGLLAVVYSFGFMLLYIAFRFDFFFGPVAIRCLFFDTLLVLGIWSLLGKEFNLQTIAALLTIVGYSMNDTIVVFDRIRENNVRMKGRDIETIVNHSLNETLSRTVLTMFVTNLMVVALWLFGGEVLGNFGLALFIGFIIATFSSISISAPLYIWLRRRFDSSLENAPAPRAVSAVKG